MGAGDRPRKKLLQDDGTWLVATRNGLLFSFDPQTKTSKRISPEVNDDILVLIARARGLPYPAQQRLASSEMHHEVHNLHESCELDEPSAPNEGEVLEKSESLNEPTSYQLAETFDTQDEESDLELSDEEEDSNAFEQMLEDHNVDAMLGWDAHKGKLVNDDRYLCLGSNDRRATVYSEWAKKKVEIGSSPRLFANLVRSKYRAGLFYLEFKRKYRDDVSFTQCLLSDKEKERMYREYARLLKKPQPERQHIIERLSSDDPVRLLFSEKQG